MRELSVDWEEATNFDNVSAALADLGPASSSIHGSLLKIGEAVMGTSSRRGAGLMQATRAAAMAGYTRVELALGAAAATARESTCALTTDAGLLAVVFGLSGLLVVASLLLWLNYRGRATGEQQPQIRVRHLGLRDADSLAVRLPEGCTPRRDWPAGPLHAEGTQSRGDRARRSEIFSIYDTSAAATPQGQTPVQSPQSRGHEAAPSTFGQVQ